MVFFVRTYRQSTIHERDVGISIKIKQFTSFCDTSQHFDDVSYLVPLFQNESKCENEFYIQFQFHANQSHFQKFGTEAQGNSEVAYLSSLKSNQWCSLSGHTSNSRARYGYFDLN